MEFTAAADVTVKGKESLEINDDSGKMCALCCSPLDDLIAKTECCENCGEFCARCIIRMCNKGVSGNKSVSCPFCRSLWPRVVIYHLEESHLLKAELFSDDKEDFPIYYTSEWTLAEVQRLKGYYCPICFFDTEDNGEGKDETNNEEKEQQEKCRLFSKFDHLQSHCFDKHKMKFCKLCIENSDLLIDECMLFTPKELKEHIRNGSKSRDGIAATKPHPWCSFHEKNFYDMEALEKHMLNEHLSCPFKHVHEVRKKSEAFDLKIFFDHPGALETHLHDHHFLCSFPECLELMNTMGSYVVFDDPMEWKLHLSRTHGRGTSTRMSLEEMHYQRPSIEYWRLKFDKNIQVIKHRRTTKNKPFWKKQMETITGSKIIGSKRRAIPDKCKDEFLQGKKKALNRSIQGALKSTRDLKYFTYITGLVATGKMSTEEYFHLHKRLFAFKTVNGWLDFYFEMLRIWQRGDQRIALYKAYEQWSSLPYEKQNRMDGPPRAPHIEDRLNARQRNSMFPSLPAKKTKKTASAVVSQSKPKPKKPTPAPKPGGWRTLGGNKQKRERRKRTNKLSASKPPTPPKNTPHQPPDTPPSLELKSAEREEKRSPSSVPHPGVNVSPQGHRSLPATPVHSKGSPETTSTPTPTKLPWNGLGRYGQRWVNSQQNAQPCAGQAQGAMRANSSNTWSSPQKQTANVLRKSMQQTQPQQEEVRSWNGIPVTFKSKKKKKRK